MPTTRHGVRAYLTTEERDRLAALAERLRLSRSDVLRRLAMNYRLPDPAAFEAADAIRDLLEVNADLARLGNLFKLALDEERPERLTETLERLATDIAAAQGLLKLSVQAVHERLR